MSNPQSRNEAILQNIIQAANNVLLPPQSRVEAILQAILYDEEYDAEAQSRIEKILIAILEGGEYTELPQSRNEEILLAKLHGTEYTKPAQSRIETLLIEWLAIPMDPAVLQAAEDTALADSDGDLIISGRRANA